MKYSVIATNIRTGEKLDLGHFDYAVDAQYEIDHNIEWDEEDIPEEWSFEVVPVGDDYEEPYDIDDDCGFDPYCGYYTYDC